ncbi:deoxyribose-phosphate aldolase [Mangrovimonas spongiae]|uniref:deoxyribose-phosphate aldolase n=1 Tax=Mangrovimonas spongiae TaxID=2494697 RepID=UPI00197E40EC|nr:deoxyribose-phosphate aldolase [Mangrovimonas spongiae]
MKTLNQYIDHTQLASNTKFSDIKRICNEAILYNFYAVCIPSYYINEAKKLLSHSHVKICTVIGFPLGNTPTAVKTFEAKQAIEDGADEIDMVLNIGLLKSGKLLEATQDIKSVKNAIGNHVLKVIIEISELTDTEIVQACNICLEANADFIKTSTGFSKGNATINAVKLIKKTVKNNAKIKASGGIRDYNTALDFIKAGANRIGTSSGVAIITNKENTTHNY